MERLLSLQDVAAATGLDKETIRRAVLRGELQAEKLCGRWRTTEGWVLEWRQANRPPPRSAAVSVVQPRRSPAGERGSFRQRARTKR